MTVPDGVEPWLFLGCLLVAVLSPLVPFALRRDDADTDVLPPLLLALSLTSLGYVAWALDDWAGLSAYWTFTVVFAVLGGCVAWAFLSRRRSRTMTALAVLWGAGLVAFHFVDGTPVKPYRRFFEAVEVGMRRDDALAVLHREFPDGGRFPVPLVTVFDERRMAFLLDPADGRWNSEIVHIEFVDGRVAGKEYLAD